MARTHRAKPSTVADGHASPSSMPTDEQIRANVAFWKAFMPRHCRGTKNPTVDVYTAEACINILDCLQDMIVDVLAQHPDARRSLILIADPPITAETMIQKLRAQFATSKNIEGTLKQLNTPKPVS